MQHILSLTTLSNNSSFFPIFSIFPEFINISSSAIFKILSWCEIIKVVPFVVFIIIAFITFSTFSSFKDDNSFDGFSNVVKDNKDDKQKDDDAKYLSKISEIDDVTMNTFHDKSLTVLNRNFDSIRSYEKLSEWESCGVYLLISNEDKSDNMLYDIFKKSYKNSSTGETFEMYAAVKYSGLELSTDNVIVTDYFGMVAAPTYYLNTSTMEFVRGYLGNDKLYNQLIRTQKTKYSIEASEGLYIED